MLAIVLAGALLAGGTAALGQAVVARHRAELAADLAAIAGASAQRSGGSGCQEAARVASINGARLETCRADERGVVEVWVSQGPAPSMTQPGLRAGPLLGLNARSHARAGPA